MPRPSPPGRRCGAVLLLCAAALAAFAAPAKAAGPPLLGASWASEVFSGSARLHTSVTANGAATSYHFDYITLAAYEANLAEAKDPFTGAKKTPAGADPTVGSGTTPIPVSQPLSGLTPQTAYRYRAVAKNSFATVTGPTLAIATQSFATGSLLLDGRAWELVSPVEKNGGQVDFPETIAKGGVFQAAVGSGAITYSSATSFGADAQGAPQGSQYIAARSGSGWAGQNITTPVVSGSYGAGPVGVPYQLFSTDLSRGLLLAGRRCRGEAGECPVANPPLPGSGALAGYENYYLRTPVGFEALLDAGDLTHTTLDAAHFELVLAGASADLAHVLLSSCAALTAAAVEVPEGEGCDPAAQNLYRWSAGTLTLINSSPGAALAAPAGAVSQDGTRVYFSQGGNLYLRQGSGLTQADEDAGGGGSFEAASVDGGIAYFTKAGHLWRYLAATDTATDLTPAGGVAGVLAASADGSRLYYQDAAGLLAWHQGSATQIAAGATAAAPANFPPATGTAHLSADGTRLAFVSTAPLTGFDNTDQATGAPDAQVYLYDAQADELVCVSCNPTGARPLGPSSLPGAYANGAAPGSLEAYKPRALSADGRRVFFDSADALALGDTNGEPDAYEWEAQGTGNCTTPGGCLALLSSGRADSPSVFLDASAEGSDAYFLTDRSLVPTDPGSYDIYDARIGGGFPIPPAPIPCEGDACQALPSEPTDPAITSLVAGPGNPPVRYPKRSKKRKGKAKKGKSTKKGKGKAKGRRIAIVRRGGGR